MHRYAIALALSLLGPARTNAQAPTRVEQLRRGDTAVVRTTGPGVWESPRTAVEVLRLRGRSPEVPFGYIGGITPIADGHVIVWDPMGINGPTLVVLDSLGRYVRTLGRVGDGPGEYRESMMRLSLGADGVLSMYDGSHMRVNRYGPTGKVLTSFPLVGAAGGRNHEHLKAGLAGSLYGLAIVRRPDQRTVSQLDVYGYIHYSSTGKVLDTIPPQRLWYSGAQITGYDPDNDWTVLPDGRILAWRTDRVGFFIKGPTGMTTAELATNAPRFDPVHRRELQAVQDFAEKHRGSEGGVTNTTHSVVPERKPAIARVMLDASQRVWLRRSVASIRVPPRPGLPARPIDPKPPTVSFDEPEVWVAFRLDGTYLGEVRFPMGVQVRVFDKDVAWAATLSAEDEPLLLKYRIGATADKRPRD
ncbi:MAG: hypothetical protein KA745_06225 [Gemmatimonadales bacterium]|nr:hypothetical protein [Gemmatimonadales bacterium]